MSRCDAGSSGAVALGRQMTVEFYDCSAEILADVRRMEEVFLEAAKVSGAHVVNSNFHSFAPQGVSGVLVISESHFAVHAWPEHDYAAVDLFTCGAGVDFDSAVNSLASGMRSGRWIISSLVNRGILHESGQLERLVPVVENDRSCGLQLSWQDRFNNSGARAISGCIDLYDCADTDFDSEDKWRNFADILAGKLSESDGGKGQWIYFPHGENNEFYRTFTAGRITGFVSRNRNAVYLNIFTDGFFDPRPMAELAMELLDGTYYRMQVQIRQ
ncbi:MAG: adenosylmethionine decarboxylase [Lentisphaerae bacterium]|nr:adenosylmethionine decarboxylase [Lentisphaerota bacterium]